MKELKRNRDTNSIVTLLICFAAYSSLYVSRSTVSMLASVLQDHGILSPSQYGLVGSLFFVIYALGRVINGYLEDIFSSKFFIFTGVLLASISNILIGLSPNAPMIVFCWGANAFGQSMVWSAILVSVLATTEPERKDIYMSIMGSSIAFGNTVGIIMVSRCYTLKGLNGGFLFPGIACFVVAVFVLFLKPYKPEASTSSSRGIKKLLAFFKDKSLRSLMIPIMVNGVLKDGITLWIVKYVIDVFEVDISAVSLYVFFVPILGFVGRISFSMFYRILGKNEYSVSLISYVITLVTIVPLCLGTRNMALTIICFSIAFAFTSMSNLSFVGMMPLRFSSFGNTGVISGSVDFLIYMGSGVSTAILGYVVEKLGYRMMFLIWAILLSISVLGLSLHVFGKKPALQGE